MSTAWYGICKAHGVIKSDLVADRVDEALAKHILGFPYSPVCAMTLVTTEELGERVFAHLQAEAPALRGHGTAQSDAQAQHSSTVSSPFATIPLRWHLVQFAAGDKVTMGEFVDGTVLDVDAEPRYSVQWPGGHTMRIKESTLRPYVPAPVVCAPDGTRCEMYRYSPYVRQTWWLCCPNCGRRLRKEDA